MKKFFKNNWITVLILVICAGLFTAGVLWANDAPGETAATGNYAVYETARVDQILTDTSQRDPTADNAYRGEQTLIATVLTGDFAGDAMLCTNTCGPIYNQPLSVGDKVVLYISVYETGERYASVYEYSRAAPLLLLLAAFLLITVLVGGKVGAKSLLGLILTVAGLIGILIPGLLKGAPTIPATFLLCAFVAVVSFTILGGVHRKTVCAMVSTVGGMLLSALFGMAAQALCRVNGLRQEYIEPLLQLRQTGEAAIGLRGLLTAGILISALGAVMDVAMSISSALSELKAVNPDRTFRQLLRSGMNIGRDMVGTMTNTLILAFFGSSLVLLIYVYSLSLSGTYFFNSAFVSIELITSLSSSIGVILAVPLTCVVASAMLTAERKPRPGK